MNSILILFVLSLSVFDLRIDATATAPSVIAHLKKNEPIKGVVKRADLRLQDLEKKESTFKDSALQGDIKLRLERIIPELDTLKQEIHKSSSSRQEFLRAKQSLKNQEYQVLTESLQVQEHLINTLETQKKALQEYAADEQCETLKISSKTYYDFEEVQQLAQKVSEVKARFEAAEKSKLTVVDDINKRKKSLTLIQEEIKEKKKQRDLFGEQWKEESSPRGLSHAQQGQLLDIEAALLENKRKLAELKIAEAEQRLSFFEDQVFIYKAQLQVLRKEYSRIKDHVRIKAADVKKEESHLETKRHSYVAKTDRLNDKKRYLSSEDISLKQKLQEAQQRFDISASDVAAIRLLNKDPKSSMEWVSFVTMLNVLSEKSIHDIERDTIDVQMDMEKAHFHKEELEVSIVRTWYKMFSDQAGFYTDEEVEQEIKRYELEKAELDAHVVALTSSRDHIIQQLQQVNAAEDKIKHFKKLAQDQKSTVFKSRNEEFDYVQKSLFEIEEKQRKEISKLTSLMETYSKTIAAVQSNVEKVKSVIDELRSKGFWKKSEQSIRWSRLGNFVPDLGQFLSDLRRSTMQFFSWRRIAQFGAFFGGLVNEPLRALQILINLIIIIILYFLLRLYLPDIINYLQALARNYALLRYFASLGAACLQFFERHLTGLYLWMVLFVLFFTHTIHDIFLAQVFYLASIPYLLAVAQQFFAYIIAINQQRYMFISEAYQSQFFWIVSKLTYAVIVILAFRQAFELGGYRGSQVPNVLMALLFVLLQVGFISLIRREQIVNALHIDTPLGEWIYDHVNKYYYFVLAGVIGVIVVSNPYIGYGRQIIYIISRVLITAAFIPLFSWIHSRLKQMSVDLFFYYTDNDEIKERFIAGRFWYGCFVLSSLLLFLVAGVYIGGRIWGMRFTPTEMASWLNFSFYTIFDETGHEIQVTIASLLLIVVYILGGIVVATLINKFILRRALDPFLVEPGIQNTILTLIRYVIIIIAAFMGLSNAGLEGLTTKIAILLAGISFAAQETVRDFFSYFILLVQRPIKIGDLIEVGDNTGNRDNAIVGVVRHITPRSIMVRQRNSVTVIIPNSRVVMHPVLNWSYSRSFIAFNDIFLTVPFGCDPIFVRQILLQVLDKNNNLLKTPAPIVRLEDFVDSGYRFLIRGFLTSDKALDQWDIASDVRLELVRQLRAQNIDVASPVRTVRLVAADKAERAELEPKE